MLKDLPTVKYATLPPDPSGTVGVLSRIGYTLEESLADLIDNSIDAGARKVLVRFVRTRSELVRLIVADTGRGISESRLHKVMQYGVRLKHDPSDLGKYGIGLKSASFSHCSSLTVVSNDGRGVSGRRWTTASIGQDWRLEVVDGSAARSFWEGFPRGPLGRSKSGTLVIWDELDVKLGDDGELEAALHHAIRELVDGLGLRFHRFLEKGKLALFLDTQFFDGRVAGVPVEVHPLNPFGYPRSGRRGFPTEFRVDLGRLGKLRMLAHIWPAKSKDPNYKLGGGKVASRQGFYFYRNDRLVQPGGWNGLKADGEPHSSLARVEIDLNPELDAAFRLTVQKNAFQPPQSFVAAVRSSYAGEMRFQAYLDGAEETYRGGEDTEPGVTHVPGDGIAKDSAGKVSKLLSDPADSSKTKKVRFKWVELQESEVFEIDREKAVLRLNRRYRSAIAGNRSSKADAPLFKLLLFFLTRDDFSRERFSGARKDELAVLNACLRAIISDGT